MEGIGGNLKTFRAGQVHRLALEVPIDDHFMGGIVNKYFGQETGPDLLGRVDEPGRRVTMVFTTYIFVFYFLPVVLAIYYLLPGWPGRAAPRRRRLAGAQLLPAGGELRLLRLVEPVVRPADVVRHGGELHLRPGRSAGRARAARQRGLAAWPPAIAISLGMLGFFKYFMFFQTNLNQRARRGSGPTRSACCRSSCRSASRSTPSRP